MSWNRVAVFVVIAACSGDAGAPPPEVVLPATRDTVMVPFVAVSAAAPLSDGRWTLLAPDEGAVLVADFASLGTTAHPGWPKPVGPGPAFLIGVGDTVVVGDWRTQQFTTWLPDGTQLGASTVPPALAGAFPSARDAAGHWYFEIGPPPGRDGSGLRDSSAIVRADAALTRFDTVARLAPADLAEVVTTEGTRYSRRALSNRERWGIERDGTMWIARLRENYVEWFNSTDPKAKHERTRSLPDPILTVQEMDRQLYVNRFPEEYREDAKRVPFAVVKPPFESVMAVRHGMFLVEKNGMALDSTRAFQVADERGVVRRIIVPSRGTALGFNGTHLLMAEQNPGGVRLLRYPVPETAIAPRESAGRN